MIYLDTETALIEQGRLAPPMTCLQFADDDGPVGVAVVGVDPVEEILRLILRDEICGHNIAFDMLVIMREYPDLQESVFRAYDEDRVTDTLVREKLLHISRGTLHKGLKFSLEALSEKYGISKDGDDPWRLRYSELRLVPYFRWPTAAREYAVHDIEATRHVFLAQGPEIPDERRQVRAAFLMHYIGATGVYTDPVAVERFREEIQAEYNRCAALAKEYGLVRANGTRDMKKAKARMKDVLGDDCLTTDKGDISLKEEACQLAGDPVLTAYQIYGSQKNLLSRIEALEKGYDKPLNSWFDSLKETGRTSCLKGEYGYQLQNMRRLPGERECFVPRPGNVFIACDYDGFELCTLAQVCIWSVGQSELAEVINEGIDPHLLMAGNALGEPYVVLKDVLSMPTHPRYKEIKEARQGCKIANFGYPGGMGAQSFVGYARGYGMNLTVEEAEDLKENWHATWPEMAKYFAWINKHPWHQVLRKNGVWNLTTVKQFMSGRVRGAVSYTEACNSYFQGLAADAAKAAGWELLKACERGEIPGGRLWNFVHDEFLLECPEEHANEAAHVVQEIMVTEAQKWIPDVTVSASPCLMRRWSKDAEPVYRDGILIPWEDR
jgi:hypothetical protein